MKKIFRSIQTFFPFLHDVRFSLKLLIIGVTKIPHEEDFNALKNFQVKSNQVFIDIGSNRGEAISSILATANATNNIIGFEPNPLIFDKLKKQFKNNSRVEVYNFGLGNTNEHLSLFVPFYRKWMFDGLSSFKYSEAEDWLKTRLWGFDEKKLTIKEVACETRKLDDFNFNPYFIKIDIQGYELEALQGSINTLKSYFPILLIESISEEVMAFLSPLGYDFYCFCEGKLAKGQGSLNTYCIATEKAIDMDLI